MNDLIECFCILFIIKTYLGLRTMARLKINILQERRVDQINLKYNGWYNKGITSTVLATQTKGVASIH